MKKILFVICIVFLFLTHQKGVVNAAPPTNFQTSPVITSGLDGPSGFDIAPDGRIFILERTGTVKIFKNGQLLQTPFVELPTIATGDRGLIGIAFDPDFTSNHYVYFYYTGFDLLNHLVRFNAAGDAGTEGPVILYQTSSPSEWLHVGGSIQFGADKKIYFAVGDNGYPPNAQMLSNAHGKILRINKDGSIPSDNPFVNTPGALPEIWAYGFRNPWRFQFDSATNKLYGGDVGDFTIEEVNHIQKGGNYGWPTCEGICSNPAFINPIHAYPHAGESAAVTGGPIYRSTLFPAEYQGSLFFADYAMGFIKRLTLDENGNATGVFDFDLQAGSVVDLKVANDGSLYYITYFPGRLHRVTYSTTSHLPVANAGADITKGVEPLTVQFTSSGSYDPDNNPLSFAWDFGDGTQSTQANPSKTYTQKGTYTVELVVSNGSSTASAIPLVIQVGNPPQLTIAAPLDESTYKAGDTISYASGAIDGAGFDINDAAIKTEVLFHHGTHIHPFLGPVTGRNGQFTIPNQNHETSADTWFEIIVTATDTNGLSTSKAVNIYPLTSTFTLRTSIPGLQVLLDGVPRISGTTIQGVVGYIRELSVQMLQELNGVYYAFTNWTDNLSPKHLFATAQTPTEHEAVFTQSNPFTAEYFANQNLTGTPVLTRLDSHINFSWGGTSPDPLLSNDNFSIRWVKQHHFPHGAYTFTSSTDDGVRVYVDGSLVIDEWHDQGTTDHNATITLSEGDHEIKMEYFEAGGEAVAKLTWTLAPNQPIVDTPSPTPAGSTPTPTPPGPALTIYDETLAPEWDDWSWDSQINLLSEITSFSGTKAISFIPLANYAGLHLHRNTGIDSALYTSIRFAAKATEVGQRFAMVLYDPFGQQIGAQLPLSHYGGDPVVTDWKIYDIPLVDFEPNGRFISSIVLQEWGGTINIPVYIDSLDVASNSTPAPSPTPTPSNTPTPTQTMPSPTPTQPAPDEAYVGSYWNAGTGSMPIIPTSTPTFTRNDDEIDFTWNDDSPAPTITLDHFIAVWTKTAQFESGNYHFTTTSDDGIRVYIDNALVINQWNDHGATIFTADKALTAGPHTIKVEYYENTGGAVAKFSFEKKNLSSDTFQGEYFANQTLTGTPTLVRSDEQINFLWHDSSPDGDIPLDHFSARWTKTKHFDAGTYNFELQADDGIRFWIDDTLIVNDWTDHPLKTYTPSVPLTAGVHELKIEYYENSGGAVATFKEL